MISIHLIKPASIFQANISVTTPYGPYAREKFNWLWKAAKPSYSIDLFSAKHGLVTIPPTDSRMILRHLLSIPRWRPKSEIEWHQLANDLISKRYPSLNSILNKFKFNVKIPQNVRS